MSHFDALQRDFRVSVADVLICLLHLADALGIDPMDAAAAKLARNRSRFPPPFQAECV